MPATKMPAVKMPRASWDSVLVALETLIEQGYVLKDVHKEIEDQVYSQEC